MDFSPQDGIDYVKDSVTFSFTALCQLPPDVLPLITLFTAVVVTGRGIGKCMQGKISMINVVVIIGSWGGYHALRENRMGLQLKQTVDDLAEQIEKLEIQIEIWDKLSDQEKANLIQLEGATVSTKNAAEELGKVVCMLRDALKLQKVLLKKQNQLVTKVGDEIVAGDKLLKREEEVLMPLRKSILNGLEYDEKQHEQLLETIKEMKILEATLDKKITRLEELHGISSK